MSQYLQKYGIVRNNNKSSDLFETLFPDIYAIDYDKPSDYVQSCWEKYIKQEERVIASMVSSLNIF